MKLVGRVESINSGNLQILFSLFNKYIYLIFFFLLMTVSNSYQVAALKKGGVNLRGGT